MIEIKTVNQSSNLLPVYASEGAAGLDLCASLPAPLEIAPMERKLIPTGLFVELPAGYEAQIRPRSGLALQKGITCLNSPGTIDSDYRGEIKILIINLGTETHIIEPGDRIAQMVVQKVEQVKLIEAGSLNNTLRSGNGFGSTGTKNKI